MPSPVVGLPTVPHIRGRAIGATWGPVAPGCRRALRRPGVHRPRYEDERMITRGDEVVDVDVPGSTPMRMHLFRPAVDGRFPGVLLFSEIYQVTAPIRRLAAMIAGNGHVVAVPEVYHEYEPAGTVLAYDAAGTDRGNELKVTKAVAAYDADSRAGLTALLEHPACNGRVGTFGVCLGGHLAYRAALDRRVSAAACFYPTDIHSGSLGEGRSDDSLARMAELEADILFV